MSSYIVNKVRQEMNDPNSEYYVGQPSTFDYIRNALYGRRSYSSNYFGHGANTYLAQPQTDTLQILYNAKESNKQNLIYKLLMGTTVASLGLAICHKVPGLNLLPKALGTIPSAIGSLFSSLGKLIK